MFGREYNKQDNLPSLKTLVAVILNLIKRPVGGGVCRREVKFRKVYLTKEVTYNTGYI